MGITYKTASFPVVSISPDGARLAYGVAIGRSDMGVAVDGKVQQEKGAFEISDLQFSPDGRHLVYRVRASSGHFVVINGQAGKKYDIVIPESLSFPERDTLMFFAVAGSRLLRVRYALH